MSDFKPRVVMVTGAAGFIGCNFVRFMLNKYTNVQIISFDKLTYAGNLDNLADVMDLPNHIFIKGDICDADLVYKTLSENQVDTVVHFAAESHVDNSIQGPDVFVQTNVNGTFNLLEQAKRYWLVENHWDDTQCRFHHVSTDEVFGSLQSDEPAFTEKSLYRPSSPYSASKAASDHLVRAYHKTYALPITMSNCSNNYGPYQHEEKLIPVIIKACLEQKQIPIYGDGSNIRDWLYVEDHCIAVDTILRKSGSGQTYNIGGGFELSNLELTKLICIIFDKEQPDKASHEKLITFVEDRKGHDWRYSIDGSKIQKALGWCPACNFKKAVENIIASYIKKYCII